MKKPTRRSCTLLFFLSVQISIQLMSSVPSATANADLNQPDVPDLICILFDDSVCEANCITYAFLFGYVAPTNKCNAKQQCICEFDATNNKYADLLQNLRKYPNTNEFLVESYKNEISTLLSDLNSGERKPPITNYVETTTSDNRVESFRTNATGLHEYLSQVIKNAFKDEYFRCPKIDYKTNLNEFAKNCAANANCQYVAQQIIKTDNKHLKPYLGPDFKTKTYQFTTNDTIRDIVQTTIVDEFINLMENEQNSITQRSSSPLTGGNVVSSKQQQPLKLDWRVGITDPNQGVEKAISQKRQMGKNAFIQIVIYDTGAMELNWEFDGKRYVYKTSFAKETRSSGEASDDEKIKYRKYIMDWCKQNHRLFGVSECTVYDRL